MLWRSQYSFNLTFLSLMSIVWIPPLYITDLRWSMLGYTEINTHLGAIHLSPKLEQSKLEWDGAHIKSMSGLRRCVCRILREEECNKQTHLHLPAGRLGSGSRRPLQGFAVLWLLEEQTVGLRIHHMHCVSAPLFHTPSGSFRVWLGSYPGGIKQ